MATVTSSIINTNSGTRKGTITAISTSYTIENVQVKCLPGCSFPSLARVNVRITNTSSTTIGETDTFVPKTCPDKTYDVSNENWNAVRGQSAVYINLVSEQGNLITTYNEFQVIITYKAPAISWTSTSTLSLSRSGTTVTATKGGTAVHNYGSAVTYYLYEGSTNKGTFSGNTLTLSNVSVGEHTYKVVASAGGLTADGASKSVTVPAAAITWSNATLTLAQSDTTVTATKGGTATHNYGTAVTYYLYEGSTKIGTFSGNTLSFTPSVGEHTYKTVASGGGVSKDGASASITVVSPHKTLKIYSSSGWVECIIYRYNGSSFIEVEPYYYNGTSWSACSHT